MPFSLFRIYSGDCSPGFEGSVCLRGSWLHPLIMISMIIMIIMIIS